ncbi:hypothetical protein [Phycobacter sp. K97]|uniref:hypothetical protein n=1 Tax=Phycobacter sedimenti TaxID=3133977 RepID=UPI00311E6348
MTYKHPWLMGGLIGIGVFAGYQFWWRVERGEYLHILGDPAPLPIALLAALIFGQALAMICWLLANVRSAGLTALRPTRGRLISAISLALVTPVQIVAWFPWIVIGLMPFAMYQPSFLWSLVPILLPVYPLAALIQYHTYQRKWLRFGLFCLYFWGVYGFHILWSGVQHFP